MDNAYPTPTGVNGSPFFSTNKTAYAGTCTSSTCSTPNDPGGINEFTGDASNTWDIRLTALDGFTGGNDPVFFFNNNQTNSGDAEDQNLAIWAALTLYDDAGVLQPLTFYFTNPTARMLGPKAAAAFNGTAGSGTSGPLGPTLDNTSTDYVRRATVPQHGPTARG
jgi:hypothetical protein